VQDLGILPLSSGRELSLLTGSGNTLWSYVAAVRPEEPLASASGIGSQDLLLRSYQLMGDGEQG
jgi:hypothetical protein